MQYTKFVQKNLKVFQKIKNPFFYFVALILGDFKSRQLKQRIKVGLRDRTPRISLTSTEMIIFERLKNSGRLNIVFDVGIQDDLNYFRIHPRCTFHLFEPNKKFVRGIKKQISKFPNNHIILNEFGLSDSKADNLIYYEESESFTVNPTFKDGDVDTGARYSVKTLDDYVSDNKIDHIDFLKIDTEGFDYKIIKGGIKTISSGKVDFLQFEYWSGVKKFYDLLQGHFDMFLEIEPLLLKHVIRIREKSSDKGLQTDWNISIMQLDDALINIIDNKLIPTGAGGNIFCIRKGISDSLVNDLTFKITE